MITCIALTGGLLLSTLPTSAAAANYTLYTNGSSVDKATTTTFGQVYMGGSTDVDEAFKWMINGRYAARSCKRCSLYGENKPSTNYLFKWGTANIQQRFYL